MYPGLLCIRPLKAHTGEDVMLPRAGAKGSAEAGKVTYQGPVGSVCHNFPVGGREFRLPGGSHRETIMEQFCSMRVTGMVSKFM